MRRLMLACVMVLAVMISAGAQERRPLSPAGTAATQVGGKWVPGPRDEQRYEGGKWIEILYNRPILRDRENIFGTGAEYGKQILAGAPVWRAGANQSTRLKTEVPLEIGGKTLAPGEYTVFIDLKPGAWTMIVSSWASLEKPDPNNKAALWGAFGYTPDKDIVRVPMTLATNSLSIDELTWGFADVTATGGKMVLMWGRQIATVPFKVAL